MHEIGHFWLGHIGKEEYKEQEESEASFFAKYALTPPIIAHSILDTVDENSIKSTFNLSWAGAKGANEYYELWLNHISNSELSKYEKKTLEVFGIDNS